MQNAPLLPTFPDSEFLPCLAKRLRHLLPWLLLASVSLSTTTASATTLVKCTIDRKTVYSDTDCPKDGKRYKRSVFSAEPGSRKVTIRTPRKAMGVVTETSKKVRRAGSAG